MSHNRFPIFLDDKKHIYNLFHGWSMEEVNEVNMSLIEPILEHIRIVYANGEEKLYKIVLTFYADMLRNPHLPPGVALVLYRTWKGSNP